MILSVSRKGNAGITLLVTCSCVLGPIAPGLGEHGAPDPA
jgi:hypothetical protein